jgi:hypothetical protein
MEEDLELLFISGKFYDLELPKEQKWLLKYFHYPVQKLFALYYSIFRDVWHFTERTGYYGAKRWLFTLRRKFETLLKMHKDAKKNFDFELVNCLETGKYRFKKRKI